MKYRNKDYLYQQYWEKGKSFREIGRENDVDHKTISYWFDKFDLSRRGVGGKLPYVPFQTAPESSGTAGYEVWRLSCGEDRDKRVRVHRLVAVAEFGFEAVKDMHVHHKNGFKMDNRPENLKLCTEEEHLKIHHEEGLYDENEFWKESPNYKKSIES